MCEMMRLTKISTLTLGAGYDILAEIFATRYEEYSRLREVIWVFFQERAHAAWTQHGV